MVLLRCFRYPIFSTLICSGIKNITIVSKKMVMEQGSHEDT